MNSSALCEWPLLREWAQINYPSHHGTLHSAHPEVCPQTRTIHYITTSLFQLKEDLVSHFLKHFGSMRLGLNIHSTSIHNHKSWARLLTDDRKTQPITSRSS